MNDSQNITRNTDENDDDPMLGYINDSKKVEYIERSPEWVCMLNTRYALMTSEGGKARVLV